MTSEAEGTVNGHGDADDTFEQDLKEMLKDGPGLNDMSSPVQAGTLRSDEQPAVNRPPSNAPSSTLPKSVSMPQSFSANVNVPLSQSTSQHDVSQQQRGRLPDRPLSEYPSSKLDTLKSWGLNHFKCTKQMLSEKLGKGTRTVDLELESKIEALRDTQRKYGNILRLARALTNHFYYVVQTQKALGEGFTELAQKSPELQEEFTYNAETQVNLVKNGETLLGALNFFTSSVNTLCNKTIDDTLLTIKHYENARLEYDAYRCDLEQIQTAPRDSALVPKIEEAKKKYQLHKDKFDKFRSDVVVKLQFLEENKIKVMHKQLLLFHNAIAAYFSGNNTALESTLKQFNIKLKKPNAETPSWLEKQ